MEAVTALAPSRHIVTETRRLIQAGWIRDGRHVTPAGISGGRLLYDVQSRTEPRSHRVTLNPKTSEAWCDCRGCRQHGHCTHVQLVLCTESDIEWNRIMFPDLPEAV